MYINIINLTSLVNLRSVTKLTPCLKQMLIYIIENISLKRYVNFKIKNECS